MDEDTSGVDDTTHSPVVYVGYVVGFNSTGLFRTFEKEQSYLVGSLSSIEEMQQRFRFFALKAVDT